MKYSAIILAILIFWNINEAGAQRVSKSNEPAPSSFSPLRTFPCDGTTIYEEGFDGLSQGQLPLDWSSLDLDTLIPHPDISYMQKGWQAILDFKDSANTAMASPSWYALPDSSDDWLITQKVQLGANPCISWYAYSQDVYYPEKYEVRVSTTTPDTAGFLANDPVSIINSEFYSENYRSAILTEYKNKEIYLAFRQKSYDKFILVLDNVRFAEVLKKDPAMYSIRTTPYADTSKIVFIRGSIINHGSDTLKIDSAQLVVHYQVNNGQIESSAIRKPLTIVPNDTLNWLHDSTWKTPNTYGLVTIRSWFTGITGQPVSNDTLEMTFGVYPTSIHQALPPESVILYPNPADDILNIRFSSGIAPQKAAFELLDIMGKTLMACAMESGNEGSFNTSGLPGGIYFLRIKMEDGKTWSGKFLKL
ncbi:MAG: choice-of-anchor J domain-containing protein [Bacteroidia bacterium]|nr:choice-of-anchor J domain-containing protein [Bacteroidia bacterium]